MPFSRRLRREEIDHINGCLSAGTHVAVLIVNDPEHDTPNFGGVFDHLQSLLTTYVGLSGAEVTLGGGSGPSHQKGIFIYKKYKHLKQRCTWCICAEVKIVPMNTISFMGSRPG